MTTYTLTLDIGSAGVQQLDSVEQCVAIVKAPSQALAQTRSKAGPNVLPEPVIWLAIAPFENITVTWQENYYIYASQTYPFPNGSIQVDSITDAVVSAGQLYQFANGIFSQPGQGDPGWMEVLNGQGSNMNFGLAQLATIAGIGDVTSPLNIVPVGNNEKVGFQPQEAIQVFAYQQCNNGTVISFVMSSALSLQLSSLNPTASAYFSAGDSTFYSGTRPTLSPMFAGRRK